MRHTTKIYRIPLWPLVKNVFLISFITLILTSLIFGMFWLGVMQQFFVNFSGNEFPAGMINFQHMGGLFIFFGAVMYGIFGSVMITLFAGFGALIYNWVNGRNGGIELEISLPNVPDSAAIEPPQPAETIPGPPDPEPPISGGEYPKSSTPDQPE